MNTIFDVLAMWMPGPMELAVIGIIGLLIFGKRLPEVGKSLGKSIVEFKKGLKGIEDDIDNSIEQSQSDMLPPPDTQNNTPSTPPNESEKTETTKKTSE